MLAQPHRRPEFEHLHNQIHGLPSSAHSTPQLSFDQLSQQIATQQLIHNYIESQKQQSYPTAAAIHNPIPADQSQFMTGNYDFVNPDIRIQQSTPTPQLPSTFAHTSMIPANGASATGIQNWHSYEANNAQSNNQSLQTPKTSRTHQRASSSSSVASEGSQYQAGPAYSYVAHSENLPSSSTKVDSSSSADEPSSTFSNHLPTPSHTPTQDSFMSNTSYNTFTPNTSMGPMTAHYAMKSALMEQNGEDDVPGFAHSARHSVSSYGQDSPATPRTAQGDDMDFKMPPNGETLPLLHKVDSWLFDEFVTYEDEPDLRQQNAVPKLENFYDGTPLLQQSQPVAQAKAPNTSLLQPFSRSTPTSTVQRALEAAHNARSQTPSSSVSRGVSPFRQNSPFRQPSTGYNSPRVRVGTAAEMREQKQAADAAHALKQNTAEEEVEEPQTISPKDALLDYNEADEDSKVPLFPEGGASDFGNQYQGGEHYRNTTQPSFDTTTSGQQYQRDSWATPQFSPSFTTTTAPSQSAGLSFAPPAIPGNLHAYASYRPINSSIPSTSDALPEFPAHLTSMESSASEAEPQNSQASTEPLQKPTSSAADSGTYTCTYHGCTMRFETPQKLQKHKREGHRSAAVAAVGSSMPSAALLERNSQAGPHKCERINPTTGKPCNTIFSRPYDLTRHEDTIHNVRKQKVKCALCVEEKTFSRNDALTRHMRVVHPEVDFPGKHRRRGGNHD